MWLVLLNGCYLGKFLFNLEILDSWTGRFGIYVDKTKKILPLLLCVTTFPRFKRMADEGRVWTPKREIITSN